MPLAVVLSVTVPVNENVAAVGVGVGDGAVVADPLAPHPPVNNANTSANTTGVDVFLAHHWGPPASCQAIVDPMSVASVS